jgi:hypothetical protein
MEYFIRRGILLFLALLCVVSACIRRNNTFVVSDPGASVASADLRLCGSRVPLSRSGSQLSATRRINCEGAGDILVRLSGGGETSCPIGYVTPDLGGTWEYVVENAQCRYIRLH